MLDFISEGDWSLADERQEFYLTPQRPSIAALHRAVCMNCQLAKTDVPSSEGYQRS
jgi:hypothetical protein